MARRVSLDDLWAFAPPAIPGTFSSSAVAELPEPARRYLRHAIAPGTPLASAVRLRMRGAIKLGRWLPFTAEQVIHRDRGFIWKASVRRLGVPIFRGFDRLVGGEAEMHWRLLGLFPVMTASGPEITRSAIGRLDAESVWLPSLLAGDDVRWTARDSRHPVAAFSGHSSAVEFEIDEQGRLASLSMQRWGNPGGAAFRLVDFGGLMEGEATFAGYTIPTRLRVGWYIGSPRFESEGEFFRATIEDAVFR